MSEPGAGTLAVRDLRQHLSAVLGRVASGETVQVTDRGRPVARIVPLRSAGPYARLVAEGRIAPPEEPWRRFDIQPLPPPGGSPLASEILADLRRDER
ncbi:MAG: type II toxin-antitoxin system Phd/YefM family antitoxin [Candidatus Dormibacteraceae bacterium]